MTTDKRRKDMAKAQAEVRRRERERGLVRVLVTIPKQRKSQLEDLVGQWILEHPLNGDVAKG
jgi:hypothetical protein